MLLRFAQRPVELDERYYAKMRFGVERIPVIGADGGGDDGQLLERNKKPFKTVRATLCPVQEKHCF